MTPDESPRPTRVVGAYGDAGDVIKTETVIIGPEYAQFLLRRNDRNRPLSHTRIARYARAMSAGRWRFTGDAIQVDVNDDLLNGQKRLHAVVLSGAEIMVNLVTGLAPEAQRYMDQGQARSAANQLAIEGVPNSTSTAAIVKLLLAWDAGELSSYSKSIIGAPDEVIEFVTKHVDDIQQAIILADRVRKSTRVATAPLGAVTYRALQLDPEPAETFFTDLARGADLRLGSPVLTLRNHLIKLSATRTRRTNLEVVYLLVVAWNAWRGGRDDMGRIQLPKGGITSEKLPVML